MERINETLADVEGLLHRVSWEVMDEEQRDEVMEKVVLPRWGKTTADGFALKGTKWAEILGTTEKTVKGRYYRLREATEEQNRRSEGDFEAPVRSESETRAIRAARQVARDPELVKELLADPEAHRTLQNAVDAVRPTASPVLPIAPRTKDWSDVIRRAAGGVDDALKAEERGEWQPSGMDVWYLRCVATLLNRRFLPSADDLVSDIEKFLETEANR